MLIIIIHLKQIQQRKVKRYRQCYWFVPSCWKCANTVSFESNIILFLPGVFHYLCSKGACNGGMAICISTFTNRPLGRNGAWSRSISVSYWKDGRDHFSYPYCGALGQNLGTLCRNIVSDRNLHVVCDGSIFILSAHFCSKFLGLYFLYYRKRNFDMPTEYIPYTSSSTWFFPWSWTNHIERTSWTNSVTIKAL